MLGGFVIRQGEADLLVVTARGMPEIGTQVTVKGVFRQALALAGTNYAVVVEQK